MLCIITSKTKSSENCEVVYKSLNYRESLDALETLALETIEKLQGELKTRCIHKVMPKRIPRGYFAFSKAPNSVTVYEKKKDSILYSGGVFEHCTFELICVKFTSDKIASSWITGLVKDRVSNMSSQNCEELRSCAYEAAEICAAKMAAISSEGHDDKSSATK